MNALVLALGVTLAATPVEMEQKAAAHLVQEFERIGRHAPEIDPILSEAARKLADDAIDNGAHDAASDVLAISGFVSDAGGADPTPRVVVIRASPPGSALETHLKRTDFNQEPTTHAGVGVVIRGDRAAIVTLLAERKATLAPFPRAMPHPGSRQLCGELVPPLEHADVYITRPNGQVDREGLTRDRGASFCAMLSFSVEGRHSVEVIGHGPRGPEVAAIFFVDRGATRPDSARFKVVEPSDAEGARAAVLARINALRQAQGLSPLTLDDRLTSVAQAYSDQMSRDNFFAHVAPDGSDLRLRLTRSGYRYERAGENLGLAAGPLAAHFALEHSPGHRKNLLDDDFTRVGIGIAFERVGDRPQVRLTEILARPARAEAGPATLKDAYLALSQKRANLHLPPLQRSEVLEQIALSHAKRALALDSPKSQLPGSKVHERVFQALPEITSASVDFMVGDDPTLVPESKSLADARNDRVGIGSVKGDSPTYGQGKYWVVVIYASTH